MKRCTASLLLLLAVAAACGGGDDAPEGAPPPIAFAPPRNPHLADSTWPIFHRDSYAQHSSELPGPTGAGEVHIDEVPLDGIAIFVLFDPAGDILAVSKKVGGATLWKITRATLLPVASVELAAGDTFAGAYGYVDAQGRAVVGLGARISRYVADADSLDLDAERDLADVLAPGEPIVAITVLYGGEIAFVGEQGTVGILPGDLSGAPLATLAFPGEKVSNGLTTDETGGIYVVTSAGLRRLDWDAAAKTLTPRWFVPVDAPFTEPRPGRLGTGSGTTPALMMDDMVAIADDAESMHLVVVRRKNDVAEAERVVCKVPVFDGPATTDNAIVVAGRTMIVEQNLEGHAGVARFDVADDGTCTRAWVADVHAPSCVPTLSTASGLVYVFTDDDEGWGLTGLDLATGARVFTASPGQSGVYNNYYAAVTIGPDERIYIGTIAGLLVFSDVK